MILHTVRHSLLTALARGVAIPAYARRFGRFERMLREARQVQRDWLFARVRRCRDTRFGRDHAFARIQTLDDFRRQAPVARYDYFAPYIDDVARGNLGALIPAGEQVSRFTITTGSTGVPKLNPVSTSWLKEYREAWNYWGIKILLDHPRHVGGKILHMAGTWNMGRTSGGIPISMVSTLGARYQHPLVRPYYAIPNEISEIRDPIARYYATLRLAICENISLIVLMNPGTLLRLVKLGDEHRQKLIRDVHDGTLSSDFEIAPEIRRQLAPRMRRPNRSHARALEQIVERTGRLYPKDYWSAPIIACWLGGTAGYQARYLAEYFGRVPMRDMGLVSSEGRHTIPIENTKPEGVLAVTAGYYEFVPVAEIDAPAPLVFEGHELEVGGEYYLLMTTSSGYYRYNIGDIVRCRGFVGQAPVLEFLQKGDRCGDLEGEKVTEHQLIEAAGDAAEALGVKLGCVTAIPWRPDGQAPCYVVLIEHGDIPEPAAARRFLETLDRRLMESNFLYSARRREEVLGPPRLARIPTGAWGEFVQSEIARRGTGDVQYKHPGLVQDTSWLGRFNPVDTIHLETAPSADLSYMGKS
ncbi:MAG TPA: GH3 auxin-responsive promoter family protein [Planctomycetaceae bacterium]|nr:GH3 auxin-responsive promoter family protein [Planctomycetaceae bacterium]